MDKAAEDMLLVICPEIVTVPVVLKFKSCAVVASVVHFPINDPNTKFTPLLINEDTPPLNKVDKVELLINGRIFFYTSNLFI